MSELEGITMVDKKQFGDKRFAMTLHNYTQQQRNDIEAFFNKNAKMFIIGHEIAQPAGTPHLQMYVEFTRAYNFMTLRTLMVPVAGHKIHFEVAKKSRDINIQYCMKEGYYIYSCKQKK